MIAARYLPSVIFSEILQLIIIVVQKGVTGAFVIFFLL
jgi:hypothetical protein